MIMMITCNEEISTFGIYKYDTQKLCTEWLQVILTPVVRSPNSLLCVCNAIVMDKGIRFVIFIYYSQISHLHFLQQESVSKQNLVSVI